uniref:Intraflagellar transport (IFT) protein n=1 Tax=Neobodo designis TaxID=312471 RepID=A0A7S1M9Y1_NEODS|mmetsp:Transcript_36830/g.113668  ORF Transcript_36830/g.113668 Transcript_36830/m.113668 type:complete len:130 (+) Transcript_36830:102-491(+)|eukprot:CAMPEP_0174849788 /NCGR_PEP_ID=MMETSP1114-20130205/17451_1 /TAXON_ID=312471 /ORGANISM="Neobodo designis, Strain CCAP 1951/1" /LENGTH=129 /DNA_ID=CAMNT_0016084191 /DNA_START=103 /DNA_END=492 /DNA_ORIENTATION=+
MDEEKAVMFDQNGALRVYDPELFDQATKTLTTQREYVEKMDQFKSVITQSMAIVQQLGKAIEREKLRAIGARNLAESEAEARKRVIREAELRVEEQQSELDRLNAEHASLVKVEAEQRTVIQRLSFTSE